MAIKFPQYDLPPDPLNGRLSGASSIWGEDSGLLITTDYFEDSNAASNSNINISANIIESGIDSISCSCNINIVLTSNITEPTSDTIASTIVNKLTISSNISEIGSDNISADIDNKISLSCSIIESGIDSISSSIVNKLSISSSITESVSDTIVASTNIVLNCSSNITEPTKDSVSADIDNTIRISCSITEIASDTIVSTIANKLTLSSNISESTNDSVTATIKNIISVNCNTTESSVDTISITISSSLPVLNVYQFTSVCSIKSVSAASSEFIIKTSRSLNYNTRLPVSKRILHNHSNRQNISLWKRFTTDTNADLSQYRIHQYNTQLSCSKAILFLYNILEEISTVVNNEFTISDNVSNTITTQFMSEADVTFIKFVINDLQKIILKSLSSENKNLSSKGSYKINTKIKEKFNYINNQKNNKQSMLPDKMKSSGPGKIVKRSNNES